MRIARLELSAFGPFTGTRLDFDAEPKALQLVYGPNEAGKSTTLRALLALWFGIPERTQDAHLHDMAKLRIGATLVDRQGKTLTLSRRKGRKKTLLDAKGQPFDDGRLAALLGGLDDRLYTQMFGLDHERLRAGAEALLRGGGDVGEGLFEASSGTGSVHSALAAFRQEADAIYRPRGQRKLNVALANLRECERQMKDAVLKPQVFEEQKRAVDDAERELGQALAQRRALSIEQAELSRTLLVLPKLARLSQLALEMGPLEGAPVIRDEDVQQAIALERERALVSAARRELEARLEREQRELAALALQASSAPSGEAMRALRERLGSHHALTRELPRRLAELKVEQREIEGLRARLGSALRERAPLDTPRRTLLRVLAEQAEKLEDAIARTREAEAAAQRLLEQLDAGTQAHALTAPREPLEALLESERKAELDREISRLTKELEQLSHALACECHELGIAGPLSALADEVLPERALVEELVAKREALDQRRADTERARAAIEDRRHALARDIALLSAEGEPVTQADLDAAREMRERLWQALSTDLRHGTGPVAAEQLRAFEAAQRAADAIADRLSEERGRASQLSQAREQLRLVEAELATWELRQRELEQAEARFVVAHEQAWSRTRLPSSSPRVMQTRAERLSRAIEGARRARELERELGAARAARETRRATLERALRAHGVEPLAGDERIEPLLSELSQLLERLAEQASEQRRRAQETARARAALEEATRRREDTQGALEEARGELGAALMRAGLEPTLSSAQTLACLDELSQLESREREAQATQERIAAMQQDMAQFERELATLAEQYLSKGTTLPVAQTVEQLERAHQTERDRQRDVARLREQLQHTQRELDEKGAQLAEVEASLAALQATFGTSDVSALREAEQRAERLRSLSREQLGLMRELSDLGEGMGLEALSRSVEGAEASVCRARLSEIEPELDALEERVRDLERDIGAKRAGLERLERTDGAAELSEQAEGELSNVKRLARRYAELRLASAILSREIERYRDAHQGPLLSRATQLFPALTLHRYRALEVDYGDDDTPRLCAVRADGVRVHVEGLSDGTRDQLYLALRIASIERFITLNQPLPLVLDDILVHFDDDRSRAALRVLGQLATRTQVLFFTHHSRVVELAREVLPEDGLCLHTLGDTRALRGLVRDDGPLFAR